jgi:hypothetical protein
MIGNNVENDNKIPAPEHTLGAIDVSGIFLLVSDIKTC